MIKRALLLIMLLIAFIISMSISASASENPIGRNDCISCHGQYVANFNDPNVPFVDRIRCYQCHNQGLHTRDYNPTLYRVYYTEPGTTKTKTAYFLKNPENVTATELHLYHSQPDPRASSCTKCHISYTCNSCHSKPVPHDIHGTSKYQKTALWLTSGVFSGPATYENSCATSNCHGSFMEPYEAVIKRSDGKELCINCHSTDKKGHIDQVKLDLAHESHSSTLRLGGFSFNVSCLGCHQGSLTKEHDVAALKQGLSDDAECFYCHGDNLTPTLKAVVAQIADSNKAVTDTQLKIQNRSCTQCHFNATVLPLGPLEHVVYHKANLSNNLDIAGAPHQNCNTCHDNQVVKETVYSLARTPIAERDYSCLVCHNQEFELAPVHSAELDGEAMELTEVHAGCNTCHTAGTEYANKVSEIIADLKNGEQSYQCTDCHAGDMLDSGHAGVIDGNCTTSCHQAALTTEHLNNPITQINNQENPLSCGTCHKSLNQNVRLAINRGETDCSACHSQAHNLIITQKIPAEIPLFPGFQWSNPQPAQIWAEESWMPKDTYYKTGKLVISNRRNDVTKDQVWEFYKSKFFENHWTLPGDGYIAGSNHFTAEFIKGKRKVTIFYYGGENHTDSPVVPSGYRLEILY